MPATHHWTVAEDATITSMARAGQSWTKIAAALGVARQTARTRGAALGVYSGIALSGAGEVARARAAAQVIAREIEIGRTDDPLPPGHPRSWSDCLGMREPYPVELVMTP
jgi:hypothetical protein